MHSIDLCLKRNLNVVAEDYCISHSYRPAVVKESLTTDSDADLRKRLAEAEKQNARLRGAIEAALRIKDLWLIPPPASEEHQCEAEALSIMSDNFTQALEHKGDLPAEKGGGVDE
jgi:hypothetical protein